MNQSPARGDRQPSDYLIEVKPGRYPTVYIPRSPVARCCLVILALLLAPAMSGAQQPPPPPPPPAGFDLPPVDPPSKLVGKEAEPSKVQRPAPPRLDLPPRPAVVPPLPVRVPELAPPTPLTPVVPAAATNQPDDLQRGESPMKNSWTISSLITAWFLASQGGALGQESQKDQGKLGQPAAGETADRLGKIERDLADLAKKFDELKKSIEANSMDKNTVLEVQKNTKDVKDLSTNVTAIFRELEGVRQGMKQLSNEIGRLREERRSAFYPPSTLPASGQVLLINAWMTPMTVVVDGSSYRLQPGESRPITKPAGNFTYEVLGVQPQLTRTVVAGETFTIRIVPRP